MSTVLRESSEIAARERQRLEAGEGRSRAAAVLRRVPMKLARLGSEEAAQSGLRYQPVAWTAIALAAIVFYFPGRSDSGVGAVAPALAQAPVTVLQAAPTTVPAPVTPVPTTPPPVASYTPAPIVAAPSFSGATAQPSTAPTTTPALVALSVRGFGWASSLSGSAVSTAGIPEGTMPVATRLGQLDKASFVRLAGTAPTLTLVEEAEGAREAVGAAAVALCPITEPGWTEEPDQSLDDAPDWDADTCVAGTETNDTWVFDLSGYDDGDGQNGFAIVPGAGAPADFQITFRSS